MTNPLIVFIVTASKNEKISSPRPHRCSYNCGSQLRGQGAGFCPITPPTAQVDRPAVRAILPSILLHNNGEIFLHPSKQSAMAQAMFAFFFDQPGSILEKRCTLTLFRLDNHLLWVMIETPCCQTSLFF
ncbi:MAG: hypothetical protein FWG62_06235 [Proteobacteria bacterium]|nr:hypothetical protein [Pseudomonadota bacterium]